MDTQVNYHNNITKGFNNKNSHNLTTLSNSLNIKTS